MRSKRKRMVIVLGAGVGQVNGVYTQDSPHRYSKPGTWRENDVMFLLSKIGRRWYIWIQSRSICFYCCIKSDGSMSPMWKSTTESEHYDDDDDSVGDCQHMGAEPAPAFVWSI
uniref:Uncharacterized protein n=1 Tax=Odontella aurita TaxID=265563 RepID=A0A7S4MAF7_9STRA